MLWTKKRKRMPHDGEYRTRSRFLWLPMEINGVYRWLERASWVERYDVPTWYGHWGGWIRVKWVLPQSKEDNE
jgi:hypothetical protein